MADTNSTDIESRLQRAIGALLCKDGRLLKCNANERSITHKLAEHLQGQFPECDVDCEYNRDGHDNPKKLSLPLKHDLSSDDTESRTVFPDIIVHHRGTDRNLLVLEVKKSESNVGDDWDNRKLMAFKSQLGYTYAAFIRFYVSEEWQRRPQIEWK